MNEDSIQKHAYYNNQWFAKWARWYDLEKYFVFPIRKKAARFLPLTPSAKIIDIATGTGAQAFELAKLGHEVIGTDISLEMLEQAKKKCIPSLKLSFQQMDATNLLFGDDSFDAATISFGLHDMPYEIDMLVLKEMKRVVKQDGWILIIDYMEPKKHWIARLSHLLIRIYETYSYEFFIKRGLNKILKEVGLSVFKETSFLGLIQIVLIRNIK